MKHVIGRLRSWNRSHKNAILSAIVPSILLVALISVVEIRAPVSETVRHIFVPTDFPTIQEAVGNASDGDFVEVIPRILPYSESVRVNKSLTVRRWPEAPSDPVIIEGGFRVVNTTAVTIANFTIQNGIGIRVFNSSDVVLERNLLTYNQNGIDIDRSSNVTLVNNVLTNNVFNFGVSGVALSDFLHSIGTTNTINGDPIRYLINETGGTIDSATSVGYLAVVNSQKITIKNLSLQDNIQGVLLSYTNSSTIQDITASDNEIGVHLVSSNNNTLRNIVATSNTNRGLYLTDSNNNTIEKNVVSLYGWSMDGVLMLNSSDNMIRDNSISVSQGVNGISIGTGRRDDYSTRNVISNNSIWNSGDYSYGIYVQSSGNVIRDNNIVSPYQDLTTGIVLQGGWGPAGKTIYGNTIYGNTIVNHYIGLDLYFSVDNVFFHNNINYSDVQVISRNSSTIWELNGLEGNYWSDYTGVDQNQDGIGDTPYGIKDTYPPFNYNNDTRPLMEPWKPKRIHPDPAWHGGTTVTTFSNSTVTPFILKREEKAMLINVTSGVGGFLETTILRDRLDGPFRLFIDDTEIFGYLPNQNETHSVFYFSFAQGFHRIKIVGTRLSLIFGDINRDGKVDGKDIAIVAKNFGKIAP